MVNSLLLVIALILGFIIGITGLVEGIKHSTEIFNYTLYVLLFFIGLGVGANKKIWDFLKKVSFRIILIPLSSIIGTVIGVSVSFLLLHGYSFKEFLIVGAGFGYYSLATVIISNNYSYSLGMLALVANLLRESFTIIFSPLLVKVFGKLAPIASGGATAMDTTLPSVVKASGNEYAAIAVFSGFVFTIIVPIIIPLLLNF